MDLSLSKNRSWFLKIILFSTEYYNKLFVKICFEFLSNQRQKISTQRMSVYEFFAVTVLRILLHDVIQLESGWLFTPLYIPASTKSTCLCVKGLIFALDFLFGDNGRDNVSVYLNLFPRHSSSFFMIRKHLTDDNLCFSSYSAVPSCDLISYTCFYIG